MCIAMPYFTDSSNISLEWCWSFYTQNIEPSIIYRANLFLELFSFKIIWGTVAEIIWTIIILLKCKKHTLKYFKILAPAYKQKTRALRFSFVVSCPEAKKLFKWYFSGNKCLDSWEEARKLECDVVLGSPIIMSPEKYFGWVLNSCPHFQSTAACKVMCFGQFHSAFQGAFAMVSWSYVTHLKFDHLEFMAVL